jgi:hypothetical protein
MMKPLLLAGHRLAEALRAENEALARLDLNQAAALSTGKRQASDAFAAAFDAAQRTGSKAEGTERATAEEISGRLRELSAENRRLLERAIDLQSRVIETIAGAAKGPGPGTYGERGDRRAARTNPLSLSSRA